jgi:hypothetical protein
MLQTRTKFVAILIVGFLACSVTFAEEVGYLKSSEPCRVVVYSAPDSTPLSEKMQCGEKIVVLERQGNFARIQNNEDKIVWVEIKNITADVPAEQEVLRLIEYQKKLETELDELNDQVKQLSETSTKLINALIAAEEEKKK